MSEKVIFIFIDSIILEKIKLGIINRKTKNKNSDKENQKKLILIHLLGGVLLGIS